VHRLGKGATPPENSSSDELKSGFIVGGETGLKKRRNPQFQKRVQFVKVVVPRGPQTDDIGSCAKTWGGTGEGGIEGGEAAGLSPRMGEYS